MTSDDSDAARRLPTGTYRLQLHREFTFRQAAEIVPYLRQLGVSHCYASPYLRARAGSAHGYDIVDHHALNPEIGDRADYEHFIRTLHEHGVGLILDIVPNHMGVGGDDNQWWMDVLENGPASTFASYFDIDWRPPKEDLRGKVLCPVLGDHYGKLLESGEIRLEFEPEHGGFAVRYYTHRFPIDPRTYPSILTHDLGRLERELGDGHPLMADFTSTVTGLRNLPARGVNDEERIKERRRDKEVHKRRLAQLARDSHIIRGFIDANVAAFNGAGDARFDLLHELLEAQAFRLAYWRVASDEINYRRFFDINDLAGLRTENPEVFEATHRLIFEMVDQKQVDGLRIDHPDGLYDPAEYYARLEGRIAERRPTRTPLAAGQPAFYLVAEKILAGHERLPESWRIHGTTGYDFANLVNGLFVYGPAERGLDRIYRRFAGARPSVDDQLYDCKKIVMRSMLSSELHVLTNYLDRISESDRHTRDFTRTAQQAALFEVVACFPVYRTYVTGDSVTAEDRRYVEWAIAAAKRRSTAADVSIFDFIRRVLLLEDLEGRDETYRRAVIAFAMRFQQFTSPVMAKGLEDTLFYRHHRLISLNEVGGDPRRFTVSPAAFHHANQERQRRWPLAMLCSSTHDTKRSEDARARIDVLSEISGEWRERVLRWSRINRRKRRRLEEGYAPDANDEYLFYQALLGVWPLTPVDAAALESLRLRLERYMLKAIREAKTHTSWINPNPDYEDGVADFVRSLLHSLESNLFLDDFLAFHRRVAPFGLLNSLSQTLFKLTAPGIPDIYQGTELWDFSLVDPDNRRPVDYGLRRRLLAELGALSFSPETARALVQNLHDGRAKLWLCWKTLELRRRLPELFASGEYLALNTVGPKAEHLCAYARRQSDQTVIVVAPRWCARLAEPSQGWIGDPGVWGDTDIELPEGSATDFAHVLTGSVTPIKEREGKTCLPAQSLFADFPVTLLVDKT